MKKTVFALALVLLAFSACTEKFEPMLDLSASEFNVGFAGEKVSFKVESNSDWSVASAGTVDWCAVTIGENTVEIAVAANNSDEPRDAVYEVSTQYMTKSVKIHQGVYEIPESYENLSANGTANSYIVKPSSKVYFNAGVKGNSAEALADVADAKLVWQSEKSLVTDIHYAPSKKIITVDLGSASGNALVAALNASGEVVWSWHLWVTDYNPEESLYVTEPNAAGTVWKFMDRNLGALSNTPEGFSSHGLLYQWGRKDPFASPVSYTNQDPDTYEYIDGKDGEPVYYDIDNNEVMSFRLKAARNGSVELAVKNPDVFYINLKIDTGEFDEYGYPIYDQGDWGKPTDDDAWGGVSMAKTVNDPCPVGYKVPVNDEGGNTPYAWLKYASMTWDTVNYGANQNGQWFPATGTRVYEGGGLDFTDPALGGNPYSGLWIGTIGSASEYSHYGQYMFIINGKRTFKVNKDSRSQGMSLRCVAE